MSDGVELLRWAAPRLRLRLRGFRNVRRQVLRRIERRCAELGLGLAAYRVYLEQHDDEWPALEHLCRVTISRFARNHAVWALLVGEVLPRLAAATGRVRAWSAGCGAGEEPYTLAIACRHQLADVELEVLGTDVDETQLARARAACYPEGALRELPAAWRDAFEWREGLACLRDELRVGVRFEARDLRAAPPPGPFDLVFCRNLAFTYFEESLQREVAASLRAVLRTGGVLVVGAHEELPAGTPGLVRRHREIWEAS
jgi:chemotaxis protein methyltransferase CheR